MTKAAVKKLFFVAVLASVSSFSLAGSDRGTIHFQGAIVEGGCDFSPGQQNVNITCSEMGKPVTRAVSYANLSDYTSRRDSTLHTDIRYLDPNKRLAIVSVTYQ